MRWLRYTPFLLLIVASCSESSNIVPVTGVLTYKGKPVTNAYIDFLPEHGRQSWGQTDTEGRFKLNHDPEHDGALIGKHKVSVRMKPSNAAEQEAAMMGKRVPTTKEMTEFFEKYNADNSKKEVTIDRATKEIRLDLD